MTRPTPMGKMFFNILATFAEFEIDLLKLRTREGMAIAKGRGRLKGKQPKLTTRQQAELVRMHSCGEYTIAELMEVFTVGRATVYRVLHRAKQQAAQEHEGTSAGRTGNPLTLCDNHYCHLRGCQRAILMAVNLRPPDPARARFPHRNQACPGTQPPPGQLRPQPHTASRVSRSYDMHLRRRDY
jgi:hypothetical protein